jgi:multisubunit Na+/H+ antiporter MnhB subunit
MDTEERTIDDVLGYGGLGLAVVAFVAVAANPEVAGSRGVVPALAGILMVVWMGLVTARHVLAHRRGRGRTLMMASWALLACLLAFAIFQAVDTAAFDDGVGDGLLELAMAPPPLLLLAPLVLASLAILRDRGTTSTPHVSPTTFLRG